MYSSGAAVTLRATPDEVWAMVGDFFGFPAWNLMVASTRVEEDGRYRRDLVRDFPDGSLEERVFRCDRTRAYSYRSVNLAGGRFPIHSYHGNLKVWRANSHETHALWTNQLVSSAPQQPALGEALIGRMEMGRKVGLEGLIRRFGGRPRDLPAHHFSAGVVADLDAPAASVWNEAGDFFGLRRWHARAPDIWREQDRRRVPIGSQEAFVERQLSYSDAGKTYSYHSSPAEQTLGVESHIGNVLVWDRSPGRSGVCWSGQFVPIDPDAAEAVEHARAMLVEFYAQALRGLIGRFGGNPDREYLRVGGTALTEWPDTIASGSF